MNYRFIFRENGVENAVLSQG